MGAMKYSFFFVFTKAHLLTQQRTSLAKSRQNIVIRTQRHEQSERDQPDAEREIGQYLGEREIVLGEEAKGQPVVDEEQRHSAEERDGQELDIREVLHD